MDKSLIIKSEIQDTPVKSSNLKRLNESEISWSDLPSIKDKKESKIGREQG